MRNSFSVAKGPFKRIITTSVSKFYTEKGTKKNQDSLNKTVPPLYTNIFTFFFQLLKKLSETVESLYVVQLKWSLWCLFAMKN